MGSKTLYLSYHTTQPLLLSGIIGDGLNIRSGLQYNMISRRLLRFGPGVYTTRVFVNSVQYGKQKHLAYRRYNGKRSQLCFSLLISGEHKRDKHVKFSAEKFNFGEHDMQTRRRSRCQPNHRERQQEISTALWRKSSTHGPRTSRWKD